VLVDVAALFFDLEVIAFRYFEELMFYFVLANRPP